MTAFNPEEGLVTAVAAIADQVDRLIVVDDGSPTLRTSAVQDVYERCRALGAQIAANPENSGIGAALNRGVSRLLSQAPTDGLVITFDQDSTAPEGYVDALLDAYARAVDAGVRPGLVGPGSASGVRSSIKGRTSDASVTYGREPIQSGLLIPAAVLREMGPFDASLFIDGVDTEFFLRVARAGYASIVAPDAVLPHRLGRAYPVRFGPLRLEVTVAADFRYYYQQRNLLSLLRRYGLQRPGWAMTAMGKNVRHLAITTVLVPGRRRRWGFALRGLRDGVRGRTGRMPAVERPTA